MEPIKIKIKGKVPFMNQWLELKGKRDKRAYNNKKKEVQKSIYWQILSQKPGNIPSAWYPLKIYVRIYPSDKRNFDTDGALYGFYKPFLDTIKGFLIEDDNKTIIKAVGGEFTKVSKGQFYYEVIIQPYFDLK